MSANKKEYFIEKSIRKKNRIPPFSTSPVLNVIFILLLLLADHVGNIKVKAIEK